MRSINSWRKSHFLGTDAVLAVSVASLFSSLVYMPEVGPVIYEQIEHNLLLLYRTTTTVAGALMGFSMTVTVLAINFWQAKWFDLIKENDKSTHEIWTTLKQTTWCLALLTGTSLFVIAAGGGHSPAKWTIVPYLIALSVALARLMRAVNIIHRMMDIAIQASRNN